MSFIDSFAADTTSKRAEAWRRGVRGALRMLPGRGRTIGDAGGFLPWAGFYMPLTRAQLLTLAERTGYEVVLSEADPYPHALLVPVSSARPDR
jgi:hypothetical protein